MSSVQAVYPRREVHEEGAAALSRAAPDPISVVPMKSRRVMVASESTPFLTHGHHSQPTY